MSVAELNQRGQSYVNELRGYLVSENVNASGKLSASLTFQVNPNLERIELVIIGNRYFGAIDQGRQPTRNRTGNGFTKDMARQWIIDKGIQPWSVKTAKGERAMSLDSQAFLVWRKVHERGFYTTGKTDEPKGKEISKKVFTFESQEKDLAVLNKIAREFITQQLRT